MFDLTTLSYILLLVIAVWIAVNYDDESGGGGRRCRIPF